MPERILTLRELNRATLARQLLLERAEIDTLAAIKQLAGMQGQLANPPYMGFWSRVANFQRADLTSLLEQRQVVRTSMMRRTLHLLSTEDYLCFYPALKPLHSRDLHAYFAREQTRGLDISSLMKEMLPYVQEKPRTNVELRKKLAEIIPGAHERLLYTVRNSLALIQVFPGGAWGVGGSPAYAEAESWLQRSFVSPTEALPVLLRSYLRAFGPASIKDMQSWSGLSRLGPVVDTLRPELVTFRDELGRELFDLPDTLLPAQDQPAPVRFIPDFDNLILAHENRQRIIADTYRSFVFPGLSAVLPTFLVDGFVRGVWKIQPTAMGAKLLIFPFEPLAGAVAQEVEEEGERLLSWIAEKATVLEVEIRPYDESKIGQNMWGRI